MFEAIQKIGRGSSCQVYNVLCKKDNKIYAIKQSSSKENEEIIRNEVKIFKIFNNECPYIINYYDFFKGKSESNEICLCIQLEYCEYGNIREIIKHGKKKGIKINELEISSIIYMVLKGINFIHQKNLINRDIKGRNILVGKNGSVKLCDFGICKEYIKNNMKKFRGGSPYWMAPEILRREEYNQSIDIWALGITCIELAEYDPPYSKISPEAVMKKIITCPPKGLDNPNKWSKEFNDFISLCLTVDKNKRPLSDELLKHDFITIIDKKNLNRNLIIYKFLNRCGYKVLYKKERMPMHLKSEKKMYFFQKKTKEEEKEDKEEKYNVINHIDSIENMIIKNNTNKIFNVYNKSNSNNFNNNFSPSMIDNKHRNSFKYMAINRNIYLRPQSVKRINIGNESNEKINKGYLQSNNDNDYKSKSDYKKNNIIYLNLTNYKNINPPLDNNTYNGYRNIIIEENETDLSEFNINKKLFDYKIKSLEKERDLVVKNIINKYQDKIFRVTQEKNNLLNRYSIKNRNNRDLTKKIGNTAENVIFTIKNKNDNTISTTTSK